MIFSYLILDYLDASYFTPSSTDIVVYFISPHVFVDYVDKISAADVPFDTDGFITNIWWTFEGRGGQNIKSYSVARQSLVGRRPIRDKKGGGED